MFKKNSNQWKTTINTNLGIPFVITPWRGNADLYSIHHFHGVIVMYDVTKEDTFIHLKDWLNEVLRHGSETVLVALVGNKSDSESDRQVTTARAQQYVDDQKNGFLDMSFIETSAMNKINVDEVFMSLANQFIARYDDN